jgi:hypothetical protein
MSLEKAIQKLTEVISGAKLAPGTTIDPRTGDTIGPGGVRNEGRVKGTCRTQRIQEMDSDGEPTGRTIYKCQCYYDKPGGPGVVPSRCTVSSTNGPCGAKEGPAQFDSSSPCVTV